MKNSGKKNFEQRDDKVKNGEKREHGKRNRGTRIK
jgi:hypothetical protein